MSRLINTVGIALFFILFLLSIIYAQEQVTITTYYPSPYGSYNELTTAGNTYLATASGNVGIGNVNPASFKVQVTGSVGLDNDNSYDLGSTGLRWRDVWCNRNAFNGSDARQKTNIIDTPLGLDFIMRLRPVQYNWKKEDDGKHQGIIAQELQALLKDKAIEFAGLRYDAKTDTYALAYTEFIAPLIKAAQELKKENDALKTKTAKLEERISVLEAKSR